MYKATMLFQATTAPAGVSPDPARTGGWSESHYFDGSLDILRSSFGSLCNRRANLLPNNTFIVGQRFQLLGGGSTTQGVRYMGNAGTAQDIPQMAILAYVPANGYVNVSRLTLRGLPDARVVGGEYNPLDTYNTALTAYLTELGLLGFRFKARSFLAAKDDVISITSGGLATLATGLGLSRGDKVRLLRTRNIHGNSVSGVYTVLSETDVVNVLLADWGGVAAVGGVMRKEVTIYPPYDNKGSSRGRVITKKVGSPFGKYRGRRSKRR